MSIPCVAVTGAAGYIGSHVVKLLQRQLPVWRITAIDNFYLGKVRQIGDTVVKHVDIRRITELETALKGTDVVVHLAAISGVDDCEAHQDHAFEVNVQGTNNVAWFCKKESAALTLPISMATLGNPDTFPIRTDQPRDPLNWYGRTKVLGEKSIQTLAQDSYPAHIFMISNLYGEHEIGGTRVSKGTVINYFVNRALAGKPLTVYEPGSQARNYIHVHDVSNAFIRSAERLIQQKAAGVTQIEWYEIASNECTSVMTVAKLVQKVAKQVRNLDVDIELIPNPRDNETLVGRFEVDTTKTHERLGWDPTEDVESTVRDLIAKQTS